MTVPSHDGSCPRCGSGIRAGARFCANCGESLTGERRASVGAAVAPQGRLSDSGALELKTLLIAATKDDYEIVDELGRGGMAVVYKAIETRLRRPVAIKILPPELTYAKGATERFQREAQTAAALDHPNIIPIYRISPGGKLCWYAMKFLEGRSLADILAEKGLLTVSETVQILEQVGSALDYAHQHGVIHRDVKPGNVMLDVNGRVTVTDFGIAKELTSGGLTGSGAIIGTPYYMSPEQCRGGKDITGAADQYSLAVMAYQMLSGQLPFDADSAIDVIHKHVAEPPPPLETLLPSIPKHVIGAINRALSKRPADRFPTVAAFVGALRHAGDDKTLVMQRRPSLDQRRSGIEKRPTLAGSTRRVAAGLVLVGGLAIGIWWLAVNSHNAAELDRRQVAVATPRTAAPLVVAPAESAAAPPAAPRSADSSPPHADRSAARPARRTDRAAGRVSPPRERRAPAGAATAPAPEAAGKGLARISVNTWANITIRGFPRRQGRSVVDSLPAGEYTVTFERTGFVTQTRTLRITAGKESPLSVTLVPSGQP